MTDVNEAARALLRAMSKNGIRAYAPWDILPDNQICVSTAVYDAMQQILRKDPSPEAKADGAARTTE